MNRRNFMAAILAGCAAPAIVKAGSIMRINPRIVAPRNVITVVAASVGGEIKYFIERLDGELVFIPDGLVTTEHL